MNGQLSEPRAAAEVLPQVESLEDQWANALDCGALGPSREEAELFYQEK